MKPMDREYIQEFDVVHRYVHGKLTAEEMAEFEVYLMEHPELLEEVQIDQAFHQYGQQASQVKKDENAGSLLPDWLKGAFGGVFASAAVVMVMVTGGLFDKGLTPVDSVSESQIYYVQNLRSQEQQMLHKIALEKQADVLVLAVTPMSLSELHDMQLFDAKTNELIFKDTLKLSDDGLLSIALRTSLLNNDRYSVKVVPQGDEQYVLNFDIQLNLP